MSVPTTCSFCCDNLDLDGGVRMDDCSHTYCLGCFRELAASAEGYVPVLRCKIVADCPGGLEAGIVVCAVGEDVFPQAQGTAQMNSNPVQETESVQAQGACALPIVISRSESTESEDPNEIQERLSQLFQEILKWQKRLAEKAVKERGKHDKEGGMATPLPSNQEAKALELSDEEKSDGWKQLHSFISQIQQQRKISFDSAVRTVDNLSIISTVYEIDCIICLDKVIPPNGVIVKDCLHMFCRDCLRKLVESSENSVEIKCPYVDGNYSCDSFLKPNELKQLCSIQVYSAHYEDLSIKIVGGSSNMRHCLTPGCEYFVEIAEDSTPCFECPICGESTCTQCQVSHPARTCHEYMEKIQENARRLEEMKREEASRKVRLAEAEQKRLEDERNRLQQQRNERIGAQEIKRRIQSGVYRACPRCRTTIEKNAGCDHMTCRQCSYEFLWSTGARYRATQ